jgi:hypothetical protein
LSTDGEGKEGVDLSPLFFFFFEKIADEENDEMPVIEVSSWD